MTRKNNERAVLTIGRHEGLWSVELDGEHFGHSTDREVARAAASKQARQVQDSGRPCEIRMMGEPSFTPR